MLKRLFSDVTYHLREMYEDLRFHFVLPDAPHPLVITDVPGLAEKIHEMEQHALAKEARRILHQH
jgi:hypothetical protein